MNLYCTLEAAKTEGKFGTGSTTDVATLKRNIMRVSRRIDTLMSNVLTTPYFTPTTGTFTFPISTAWLHDSGMVFNPGFPVQAVTTVTFKHRNTSEVLTGYVGVDDYRRLEWTASSSSFWAYVDHYGFGSRLEIVGTVGWANTWLSSGDTVEDNPLSSSATTVTVNDVDGLDLYGIGQRFDYGSVIKVGSEIMHVTAIDTGTNTMTVLRGQNGTTAAAHAQNTAISVLEIPEPIQRVTARQAGLLYARRGAFEQVTTGLDGSTTTYPSDLITELKNTLGGYRL